MGKQDDEFYSDRESAKRRDSVIRAMVNTPPNHKVSPRPRKTGKKAGAKRRGRDL